MAKQPSSAPRKDSRPAPKSGGRPNNWRRGQSPSWGSFWSLLWRKTETTDDDARLRADPQRRKYKFRVRLAGALMTAAILIGVIVVFILRPLPTQTPLVAVAVTDYAFPVPPNSYALEDLRAFHSLGYRERLEATRTNVRWMGKSPTERVRGGKILDELRLSLKDPNCRPGGPGKNVLLVYVSAHGVVNGKGEACLLEADSNPLRAETWVSFKLLLDELRDHPEFGVNSPDQVHTVLLLDCSRSPDEWHLGQLYNSFVARLEPEVARVNHPRLTVISSAGLGQTGWTSPALGGSVFGFFLKVGLGGAANANGDKHISLGELRAYLAKHVTAWSHAYCSAEQTPLVIGSKDSSDELPLAFGSGGDRVNSQGLSRTIDAEIARRKERIAAERDWVEANSSEVATAYEQLSRLSMGVGNLHPASLDPLTWGRLRQKLVHLDRLLLAGEHYHKDGSNFFVSERDEVLRLLGDLSKPRLSLSKLELSYPLAEQFAQRRQNSGEQSANSPVPEKPDSGKLANPNEIKADKSASKVDPQKVAWEQLLKSAVSNEAIGRDDLTSFKFNPLESATTLPGSTVTAWATDVEPVEIHFLRMLAAYLPEGDAAEKGLSWALRARQQAERTAAPADIRTHHWLAGLVNEGDAQRRLAEDRLFVGSTESLEQAHKSWPQIVGTSDEQGVYQRASALGDDVARALRRRDESWADALYLSAWALSRENVSRTDDLPKLKEWLKNLHALGSLLHVPPASDAGRAESVLQLVTLERALGSLHADLVDSYTKSRPDPNATRVDQSQVTRFEQLLRFPPLDLSTGKALHGNEDARLKYVDYLFTREQPAGTQATAAASGSRPIIEQDQRVRLWEHRFGLDCLLASRKGDEGKDSVAKAPASEEEQMLELAFQGEAFRQALGGAEKTATELEGKALEIFAPGAAGVREGASFDANWEQERQLALRVRQRLSEADVALRAAAPLLPVSPAADPTLRLARLDTLCEFLWHARRALDDFWGPWPASGEPYFSLAAKKYLAAAGEVWAASQQVEQLSGSLKSLAERRLQGAELKEGGIIPLPTEADLSVEGQYTPQKIKLVLSGDVPAGEAAVFVRRYGQQMSPLKVFAELENDARDWQRRAKPVPVGPDDKGLAHRLAKSDLNDAQALQAATLFRGHVRTRDFPVYRPGQGEVVSFEKPRLVPPKITVSGGEKHTKVAIFIFDCSISMRETISNPGPEQGKKRIEVAKQALNTILDGLPDESFLVGLRVYGHRAGWYEDRRVGVRYSELLPAATVQAQQAMFALGKGPPPPVPSNDVEELVKPAPLNDVLRANIRAQISGLTPHGETPLCYSISQALDDLAKYYAEMPEKQIVVLTDGFNYQATNANAAFLDNYALVSEDKLLRKLQDNRAPFKDIRLDIVGFDMGSGSNNDERNQLARLHQITKLQNGKYRPATDLATLTKELNDSIVLPMFEVQPVQTGGDPTKVRLGKTWRAEENWTLPEGETQSPHVVTLPLASGRLTGRVDLEGGEALRMFYTGNGLGHEFYAPKTRFVESGAESMASDGRHHVTAFVPVRVGRGIEFPVAIQHARTYAHLFTGRPRHVWAEIRPLDFQTPPKGNPPVYYCYDPAFENDTPKPVLRFSVSSWPEGAKRAQIRVWFRAHEDTKSPLAETLPWAEGAAKDLKLSREGFDKVKFDVQTRESPGQVEVDVTERHERAEARDLVLRVRMFPTPDKGHHVYYPEAKMVKHHFVFLGTRPAKIEVASRDDIQTGAITLLEGRAVEVTLPQ